MINKDECSWLILLCARVNENQLNHGGPSQRHIVKPQPPGEAVIESEARTAVVKLQSEA